MKLRDLLREDAAEYRPPGNPEQLMADFYVLGFLSSGPVQSTSHRQDELDFEVQYDTKILLPYLREHLLEMAGNSITFELRHIFDKTDSLKEELKIPYLVNLGVPIEIATELRHSLDVYHVTPFQLEAQKQLATAGCEAFAKLNWYRYFGGQPWEVCCKTWLALYDAKSLGDISVYCDKIYSIQHNTGAFLNKNYEYKGKWLEQLLDIKFNAKEPEELIEFTSHAMRQMAQKILKSRYGRGMDQHKAPAINYTTLFNMLENKIGNLWTSNSGWFLESAGHKIKLYSSKTLNLLVEIQLVRDEILVQFQGYHNLFKPQNANGVLDSVRKYLEQQSA